MIKKTSWGFWLSAFIAALILLVVLGGCDGVGRFEKPTVTENLAQSVAHPAMCVEAPETQACLEQRSARACWMGTVFVATSLSVRASNDFVEAARVKYMAANLKELREAVERGSPALELDLATFRVAVQQIMVSVFGEGLTSLTLDFPSVLEEATEVIAENEFLTAGSALLRRKIRELDSGEITVSEAWDQCETVLEDQLSVLK